ncbi:MAG: PIN domain-containing protein [Anaerolineales bacterium]|nr:MAG: PIN domain-containing protein [Anaerolineales bacterium]
MKESMQWVFVDTSAFIALLDPRDDCHDQAMYVEQSLSSQATRLLTTNFVLDETYTGLRGKIQHSAILRFRDSVRQSRRLSVIRITEAVEDQAWEIFARYHDKDFSFTDCTSFAVMRQLDITTAFAFDEHFEQFGFMRVLE